MLRDLIVENRSYRRFYQEIPVELETLRELVDLARLSTCGGNRQPLKYMLSCELQKNALIFQNILLWAHGLKDSPGPTEGEQASAHIIDWPGPSEGERPSAYIIILWDKEIRRNLGDGGIAAHSILLGAIEKGLGGCMFEAVNRIRLRKALGIPRCYDILLVVALGKPKETVVIETVGPDGDFNYWRDGDGVHHVPKRRLDDIIIG